MYFADPLNQHKSTVRFAHAAFARAAARGRRRSIGCRSRRSSIHGGADRLVPTATSEALEGRPGVTRRVYPALRHELHNEPEGPQVVSDIIALGPRAGEPDALAGGHLIGAGVPSRQLKIASGERSPR